MKNTEVEKIHYWLALVGQLGWSKIAVAISKTFYVVLSPIKFHPNRMKNTEVQIFDIVEK